MSPLSISDEFAQYYGDLYNLRNDATITTPTDTEIETYLNKLNLPTLTTQQKETLTRPVTPEEPGKPPTYPQNFRPISLLNTDTKILAKLYAIRLGPILPHIIHDDQVGFVTGRQGADNTRKVLDLMQSLGVTREGGVLLSLDAEKAFDRLGWGFL
ncbi:endonuclease [Pelobates cultripes]|uniref:Endonuclease, partial n=1 Tax=Pelobates cultripes TaxID=61616 RepID=A0AAD1RBM4_PELCU|nr:endonuclease [Pelobates cultripes]